MAPFVLALAEERNGMSIKMLWLLKFSCSKVNERVNVLGIPANSVQESGKL
jgi:hypothetical protein